VSLTANDNEIHSVETEVASVFEAAYAGLHDWCRQWWYSPDVIIEVRAGESVLAGAGEPRWPVVLGAVP
jgi:hypothetical protein